MTFVRLTLRLLLVAALAGCDGDIEPGTRPADHPIVPGLRVAKVEAVPVPAGEAFVGTVESRDRGVLTARTDGRVARLAVREGAVVQAGELLLALADNPASDRLHEAEAAASGAEKRLAAARARAELAQKTFERYRRLFRSEAVTAQEMDRVAAELEEARQQTAAAEAAVAAAEAARSSARTTLAYSRVTAPYAARVVRTEVEEGSTVQPGAPLIVLDRADGWRVRAEIPETKAGRVAAGDPVQVEVPALGRAFAARISEVQGAADPRSRTFQVRAELPADAPLTAGLFARVVFPGTERPAVLVPTAAVVVRGQLTGVYLVRDDILRYRLVKTGREIDGRLEILSGLDPGDLIVVEGVERARSGARVEG